MMRSGDRGPLRPRWGSRSPWAIVLAGMPAPRDGAAAGDGHAGPGVALDVPGRCDDATVTVTPDKTGQQVAVQRLENGAWSTFATGTLGAGSTATIPLCFGWGSLGIVPLRAAWNRTA